MWHFSFCYAEYHYAECHYAECRYAECRYAECRYAGVVAPAYLLSMQRTANIRRFCKTLLRRITDYFFFHIFPKI